MINQKKTIAEAHESEKARRMQFRIRAELCETRKLRFRKPCRKNKLNLDHFGSGLKRCVIWHYKDMRLEAQCLIEFHTNQML